MIFFIFICKVNKFFFFSFFNFFFFLYSNCFWLLIRIAQCIALSKVDLPPTQHPRLHFRSEELLSKCTTVLIWCAWTCPGKAHNNVLIISVCSRDILCLIHSGIHLMSVLVFLSLVYERSCAHIPVYVSRVSVEIPYPLSGLAWREKAWTLGKPTLCCL